MEQLRDLTQRVKNCQNFTYKELINSDTARRFNIEIVPTESEWQAAETLCEKVLQPLRNRFGPIKINSFIRNRALSTAINKGVAPKYVSFHEWGAAADIEPVDKKVELIDIFEYIHNNLPYTELIAEHLPKGWIHVAYLPGDVRKMVKVKELGAPVRIALFEEVMRMYKV